MNEVLQVILGAVVGAGAVAVAGYIFARQNAKKVAIWMSKMAAKITFGNVVAQDKLEDVAGDWLIALGKELKNMHKIGPDEESGETNPSQ